MREEQVHAVRRSTAGDRPAVVRTLARAFFDDPVMRWLFPRHEGRGAILEAFFDVSLGIYLRHDETYVHGDCAGAALWAPPGAWKLRTADILRSAPRLIPVMRTKLVRGLRVMTYVERHHPTDPHFYLAVLGTDPEHQNRGIGSVLLRSMTERCDREGLPAYLEASSEDSKRLYERHGFRVTKELPLPPDGPPVWLMWRDVGGARRS